MEFLGKHKELMRWRMDTPSTILEEDGEGEEESPLIQRSNSLPPPNLRQGSAEGIGGAFLGGELEADEEGSAGLRLELTPSSGAMDGAFPDSITFAPPKLNGFDQAHGSSDDHGVFGEGALDGESEGMASSNGDEVFEHGDAGRSSPSSFDSGLEGELASSRELGGGAGFARGSRLHEEHQIGMGLTEFRRASSGSPLAGGGISEGGGGDYGRGDGVATRWPTAARFLPNSRPIQELPRAGVCVDAGDRSYERGRVADSPGRSSRGGSFGRPESTAQASPSVAGHAHFEVQEEGEIENGVGLISPRAGGDEVAGPSPRGSEVRDEGAVVPGGDEVVASQPDPMSVGVESLSAASGEESDGVRGEGEGENDKDDEGDEDGAVS